MPAPTPQEYLTDALFSFEAGVNNDTSPLLLAKNQMASGSNVTVRGTFARPRSAVIKYEIDFGGDAALEAAVQSANWQGAALYKPDNGTESLVAALGGKLYQFQLRPDDSFEVYDRSNGLTNPSDRRQAWLWQSEKWIIWNDGVSLPIFFDGANSRRSNGIQDTPPATYPDVGAYQNWVVPFIDGTSTVSLNLTGNYPGSNGDIISLGNGFTGTFKVNSGAGTGTIVLQTVTSPVPGVLITGTASTFPIVIVSANGSLVSELPAGRMGVYGLGRNWISLVDGRQFLAGDIVNGSSGTPNNEYRDAVLRVTENGFLAGGGNFVIPGSIGDIRAMRFAATLDASLGQGPLQVFTPFSSFSCQAPVDRLTWQDVTNPILTQSQIGAGALGQNSTINANSDIFSRDLAGMRSQILGRRQFQTWGNVPISQEVQPLLDRDSVDLLQYGSAVNFDNRLLMTASPVLHDRCIYHRALIPLNFDPISSLRGKAPSIYDSLSWSGLNVIEIISGIFSNKERCFAFCFNTSEEKFEIYEILKTGPSPLDDDVDGTASRIVWTIESPAIFNYSPEDPHREVFKQLMDGEIYIDQLEGTVDFQAWWKPDQWPCWIPWIQFSECQNTDGDLSKPQFRPRIGLGEPPNEFCDETNDRNLRVGKTFQVKFIITGKCRFLGARFKASIIDEPEFAQPPCNPICTT